MIEPSLDKLMEHVNGRYFLVIVTSKRARQLTDGDRPLVKCMSSKPVTVAVNEIAAGKIIYMASEKS